ncbi:MAG: two-component system LytT family sensor kinase [Dokdonia sp.]
MYRYLITTREDDIVTLTEELTMVKDYFYLIKTRFGEAYTFEIDEAYAFKEYNDAEVYTEQGRSAKAYIPSGALQTVIENVVKHNKVIHGKPVDTLLKITKDAVILTNTKSTMAKHTIESLGTGLKNLKERYELLLDKTIFIQETDTHFEVRLPLVNVTTTS